MRRPLLIVAACVLFVSGTSMSFADDRSDCLSPGDAPKRIAACSRAIKAGKLKSVDLAAMLEARGRAYLANQQRDLAIADLNEGIRISPSADLYSSRGEIHFQNRAYDLAIADFDEAIRLDQKSKRLYLLRGRAHAARQSPQQALADFDEAIRLDGGVSSVGTNATTERKTAQAALLLQQMSTISPDCLDVKVDVRSRIAQCKSLLAAGKVESDLLLSSLRNRIADDDNNDRTADVISNTTVMLALDPADIETLKLRAVAYVATKEFDLALADFTQLARLNPGSKEALMGRGAMLIEKGDFDGAIAELNEVLRKAKDASALTLRGRAYAGKQEYARALSDYDDALRLEPRDADIVRLREAARMALATGRLQAALPAASRDPAAATTAKAANQQIVAAPPQVPAISPVPPLPRAPIGKRVALVMGNGAYQHVPKLENTLNDARTMRDALTALGFEVIYGENLDRRSMGRHIGEFSSIVRDAEAAIVYFAGHGSTFGDIPYVVPVDSRYEKLSDIPTELIQVETLVSELRRAKGVRLVILDACRDNERELELRRLDAAARGQAARGGAVGRGLARLQNPDGLIVVYSTQHMTTAADGNPGGNSPFTGALARHLMSPGIDIKDVLFRAGQDVITQTGGAQRPEISISLYDPFVLAQ